MAQDGGGGGGGERIKLEALNSEQLQQLAQQLKGEIQTLAGSFQSLKGALTRFESSRFAIANLRKLPEDATTLVPITESLYVPGRLASNSHVITDIGTGYYVKQGGEAAEGYCKRRSEWVQKKLEELAGMLSQKQKAQQAVTQILQVKLRSQAAAAAQGGGSSS